MTRSTVGIHQLARLLGDWSSADGVLHVELARRLRELVREGRLSAGVRMPSERSLGQELHLSRNTVAGAFDVLRGEGILTSRQGDGTYVSAGGRGSSARGDDRLFSFVSSEPATSDRRAIDLRSAAVPGLEMVADEMRNVDLALELVGTHGYVPSGLRELREAVAAYYSDLGLETVAENILITSGAQQALRLAAAARLSPGDVVLMQEPSFRGAIEALRSLGARLVALPPWPAGDWKEAIERLVERARPALIVVQSTVHNPTGQVMPAPQRRILTEVSSRFGVGVIDDTTLLDTLIDDDMPDVLRGDQVMTVGSVSKSFWGGLRVGWLRADADTIGRLASMKGGEDLGTSIVAQSIAASLLPRIDDARAERRRTLRVARDRVMAAVASELPEWEFRAPVGGASLWIRLPGPTAGAFAEQARREGVYLLPGPTFSCEDGLQNQLRVAYADDVDETIDAIGVLARVWGRAS